MTPGLSPAPGVERPGLRHPGGPPARSIEELARLANRCRRVVLEMIDLAGSGHVGSSLSCADIVTVLKFDQMRWAPRGSGAESDVFVLSKGHAVPAWYAALLVDGDADPARIDSLRRIDSEFQGHPDRTRCRAVDVSTGALGQGLSMAIGHAEAARLAHRDSYVFCLLGDGELQEGQVWEAAMYAGVRRVANLVAVVDRNGSQNDGPLDEVMPLDLLRRKFEAFRWHVQETDGHSLASLRAAVLAAKENRAQPSVVIARTRKGHLGPGRTVLGGAHSGTLTAAELREAIDYLGAQS